MKNVLYIAALLFCTGAMAQDDPKHVTEETTVKTVKINNGDKVEEKKMKFTKKKEQAVELDHAEKDEVNQDVVESPIKVTKTLEVDDDSDDSYDAKIEMAYFTYNDEKYSFEKEANGFVVSTVVNDSSNEEDARYGHAFKTSRKNNYFYRSDEYNGIGYFDEKGDFVVEYYNPDTETVDKKEFKLVK